MWPVKRRMIDVHTQRHTKLFFFVHQILNSAIAMCLTTHIYMYTLYSSIVQLCTHYTRLWKLFADSYKAVLPCTWKSLASFNLERWSFLANVSVRALPSSSGVGYNFKTFCGSSSRRLKVRKLTNVDDSSRQRGRCVYWTRLNALSKV